MRGLCLSVQSLSQAFCREGQRPGHFFSLFLWFRVTHRCHRHLCFRLFGNSGACSACGQSIPASELVMRAQGNVYHLKVAFAAPLSLKESYLSYWRHCSLVGTLFSQAANTKGIYWDEGGGDCYPPTLHCHCTHHTHTHTHLSVSHFVLFQCIAFWLTNFQNHVDGRKVALYLTDTCLKTVYKLVVKKT